MTIKKSLLLKILISVLLFLAASSAYSFKFEPISMDFTPRGTGASRTFRVTNNEEKLIAVSVSVVTREMHPDGSESHGDARELFTVFPKQIVLQPSQVQSIRVQWKGPESVERELAFRIIVEQLPVSFQEKEAGSGGNINIMFKYIGSIYVVPQKMNVDVAVTAVEAGAGENGEEHLRITLENRGTVHTLLKDLRVRLAPGYVLEGDVLKGISDENLLAGGVRTFTVPKPENLSSEELDVALEFEPVR